METHRDNKKNKGMVDISAKLVTKRTAIASCVIMMSKEAFKVLMKQGSPKGDVFETSKVAGIMAAKSTPVIIPLCHPLDLSKVQITHAVNKKKNSIAVTSQVVSLGRTGVEMEALVATSVAALTIYDMMKWADKSMTITDLKLLHKSGGKSGDYHRE